MRIIKPNKWMRIKSWETLEKECNSEGLTNRQSFKDTKDDSFKENGWGETDEDGEPIGSCEDYDYETSWKQDTMFRMLDENLNYGKYNETEEERNSIGMIPSALEDLRSTIAKEVAWAWIFGDNGYDSASPFYDGNEVYDMETAQKMADELVGKYDLKDFMPITA